MINYKKPALALIALLMVPAMSGCGSDSGSDDSGAAVGKSLTVAMDLSIAPNQYMDNGEPAGFTVELAQAIAAQMGRKLNIVNTPFSTVITAISTGRYDAGMAGYLDTLERENQVDFVSYMVNPGQYLVVPKGNPGNLSAADLCGGTVGTVSGSTQEIQLNELAAKCLTEGKAPLKVKIFGEIPVLLLALKNKQIDGMPLAPDSAVYLAEQNPQDMEVIEDLVEGMQTGSNWGIMVKKGNAELAEEFRNAVDAVIASGKYEEILTKYRIQVYAIDKSAINTATS